MNTKAHSEIANLKTQDLAEASVHRYGEFSPHESIIQSCKFIIKNQVKFIQQMTPVAMDGRDKEGVHKMRVGLRRVRTCLQLIKPFVRKKTYKFFQRNSKVTGQVLGKIRDIDVLMEHINSHTRQDKSNSRFTKQDFDLSEIYNKYKNIFLEYISSPDYVGFLNQLEDFSHQQNSGLKNKITKSKEDFSIKNILPEKLLYLYSRMENYGQKFQSPQQYHIYHSFRKDTKKFRYSLEFFSSVYNFLPYYTLVNELIVLQDQLGFLNDCVVAHEFLTEHLNSELLLKKSKDIESIEKYISFRISEKNLIIESLPDLWEDFQLAKPSLLLSHSLAPLTT